MKDVIVDSRLDANETICHAGQYSRQREKVAGTNFFHQYTQYAPVRG